MGREVRNLPNNTYLELFEISFILLLKFNGRFLLNSSQIFECISHPNVLDEFRTRIWNPRFQIHVFKCSLIHPPEQVLAHPAICVGFIL